MDAGDSDAWRAAVLKASQPRWGRCDLFRFAEIAVCGARRLWAFRVRGEG